MKEHNEEKKSVLDSLEKNGLSGGFSVPENYFEMLSENISDKVRSIPNFASVPKENVFEVPDGYFIQLENTIRENISSRTETVSVNVGAWFRRPKLVAAFASLIVVVIAVSAYFISSINTPITEKDISFNDIYVSDFVSELDESSLAALLDEPSSSPSSTQLEDYMIDNNIDISTLTDEL